MEVIDYSPGHKAQVTALMAELQDHEVALDASRTPGAEIAERHFEYLLDCCARQRGSTYLAVDGDRVLGFVVVLLEQEDEGDLHVHEAYRIFGLVTDLVVAAADRGRGVAAALMARAESHVRDHGVATVHVTALAANELATSFYRKAGYRPYEITFLKHL